MKDVTTILLREGYVLDMVPKLRYAAIQDVPRTHTEEEFVGSMGEGVELIS